MDYWNDSYFVWNDDFNKAYITILRGLIMNKYEHFAVAHYLHSWLHGMSFGDILNDLLLDGRGVTVNEDYENFDTGYIVILIEDMLASLKEVFT